MESPHEQFRRVLTETGDRITAIRVIREQFGLDFKQAKEVMLQAEGVASSLVDHEDRVTAELEQFVFAAEISYDLVMGEEMEFVEGTYRLPDRNWQVFIISRYDVQEPEVMPQQWESGVTGLMIRYPRSSRLDRVAVERILSTELSVRNWIVVSGPDSMKLR